MITDPALRTAPPQPPGRSDSFGAGRERATLGSRALRWRMALGATPLLFGLPGGAAEPTHSSPPVAIVLTVSGDAVARSSDAQEAAPVAALDWYSEGVELSTAEDGALELVFRSGARWRLGGGAAVRLEIDRPEEIRAPVERLPDLPVTPEAVATDPDEVAHAALTAVRIRGQGFSLLYPDRGARALAGSARLFFQPDLPFERYRVEVEDQEGRLLLDLETREHLVEVPPGVLDQGATYYWRVRTRDALGHLLWEEARFETLPGELARRRQELHRVVERPEAAAMLAAVDHDLGLWWEARATLEDGLRHAPGDTHLAEALERLQRLLGWGASEPEAEP